MAKPLAACSGLGDQGVLFKLPDRYLQVYRSPHRLECTAGHLTGPNGCSLAYGKLAFDLRATAIGSINQLTVQSTGLEVGNPPVHQEIDGTAHGAEIADLDAVGWPAAARLMRRRGKRFRVSGC